ncbi:hypothetical protein TWF281_000742 [Arthrobotrys megalospora]
MAYKIRRYVLSIRAEIIEVSHTAQVNHVTHAMAAHALAEKNPRPIPKIERYIPDSPETTPESLFSPGTTYDWKQYPHPRFVHLWDPKHILIYTDGACSNNGAQNAAAGCAFRYRPAGFNALGETTGIISFRLEDTGPSGLKSLQTSNRAELRAVIGALRYRIWYYGQYGEEYNKITIATDSEYVVLGITKWIRTWGINGWITSNGKPVANRDLWEELLGVLRVHSQNGTAVEFWRIPRNLNTIADKAAKAAASLPRVAEYTRIT